MKKTKTAKDIKIVKQDKVKNVKPARIGVIICILLALIVYGALLYIESSVFNSADNVSVCVAKTDIPYGLEITEQNAGSYFTITDIPAKFLPETYVTSFEQIYKTHVSIENIQKGTIISPHMFSSLKDLYPDIINPVEVSLSVSNLAQIVGGTVSRGDYINIWGVTTALINGEEIATAEELFHHVYVIDALTSSGIANSDEPTLMINIVVDESNEQMLYENIANNTLRISKVTNSKGE